MDNRNEEPENHEELIDNTQNLLELILGPGVRIAPPPGLEANRDGLPLHSPAQIITNGILSTASLYHSVLTQTANEAGSAALGAASFASQALRNPEAVIGAAGLAALAARGAVAGAHGAADVRQDAINTPSVQVITGAVGAAERLLGVIGEGVSSVPDALRRALRPAEPQAPEQR